MTTAIDLITDAAYAAQVLGQDQTLSSGDAQLLLRRLNRMLDSWSNEKQLIFSQEEQLFTTVAGQQAYTTAVLTGGRPVGIDSMRMSLNGVDYVVDSIDQFAWNDIPVKNIMSIPTSFYYDGASPIATMFFYPIPYAAFTVHIYCQRVLTAPLTLTSVITMPPGYEAAIVANLAIDAWSSFKKGDPSNMMLMEAKTTRAVIKRTNFRQMEMVTPFYSDGRDISNSFPYPYW